MPLIRRHPHASTTAQPADSGTVPSQRATPESTRAPEEVTRVQEGGVVKESGRAPQTTERQAAAHAYGEPAESRAGAPRRYYGMAGTLLLLSGLLTFFIGITAVIRGAFFNQVANYPFYYSVRSRGVTLLVISVAAFLIGVALLIHMRKARTVATVVAAVTIVANFMFLPFFPFWSVIVLALNVIIVWDLTREREDDRRGYTRLPRKRPTPWRRAAGSLRPDEHGE